MNESAILANNLGHVRRNRMNIWGVHGIAHWWRVRHNGLLIADQIAVDPTVVTMFALCHDAFRQNDYTDPEHGPRAAAWLESVRSGDPCHEHPASDEVRDVVAGFDQEAFTNLVIACREHTSRHVPENPTIATCFAADRLDLWRVGTRAIAKFTYGDPSVVTQAFIEDAMQRSEARLTWVDESEFRSKWGMTIPPDHE